MSQSPLVLEETVNASYLHDKNLYKNIETKILPNQQNSQSHSNQRLYSPSSNGSLKASPQIYHSPQIGSNNQRISKFNTESGFSPSLKNRIISQATLNRGSNTPTSSFFKQTENSKDSPILAEFEQKNTRRQSATTNFSFNYKNSQSVQNLPTFGFNTESKAKKEETVQLPQIEQQQTTKSVQKIKNKLSQLEDKQCFFNEINKLSRKSLGSNTNTLSDQVKMIAAIPDIKSNLNQYQERDQLNQNQQQAQKNQDKKNLLEQANLTLQVTKSPNLGPTSRPSIFQESQSLIKSDQRLTPQRIYGPNPNSCLNKFCFQPKETNEYESLSTFKTKNSTPMKKASIIFKYPIAENSSGASTLQEIEGSYGIIQNINNNNNQGKNQTKDQNSDIQSSQTISSEEDSTQTLISQIGNNSQPKIKQINNIQKLQQMESIDSKNPYFSPQIGSQTLRRRKTANHMVITPLNSNLQKIQSPINKDEILYNLTSRQNLKSERIMNLFQNQYSANNINSPQSQSAQLNDRAALMRQLYFLLPDLKKFVTEEIEKDEELKSSVFSFYMMQDINEFSFHFSQYLDHLAEQRQLTQKTFPNKFPKKILSKITSFMLNFLSQQPENSEQLKCLLNEQITKSLHIVMPSTLLEALGGYSKVRAFSQQIFKMLQTSALSSHILIHSEEEGTNKIEEFLLAALQQDLQKTQKMLDEFKKYTGTSFSGAEFYVTKQILYNYFSSHTYYSDEVKYAFFELLESVRYQVTEEEGFSQNLLEQKQAELIKEMNFIWKQDPILSKLKESQKNSSSSFIQAVFDYTFSCKNCYQISNIYYDSFSSQLDILVVKSLHQMVKVATRRQGIVQNQIQMNINFLFKKFQWFIQKNNSNYVSVVGNCKEITDQMLFIILNQKVNNESPTVPSPTKVSNSTNDLEGKQNTKTKNNKFRILYQLQQTNQQQNQQKQNLSTYQPLTDISNFSQFLSLFFNFYSTFHYSDLVNFFKSEKCTIEIFQFWTQIFSEALVDVRGISTKLAGEISKFIYDLFEFLKNK
ncbi:hypothetical protein ABPG74_022731 [Tetrahymena malaccensis]